MNKVVFMLCVTAILALLALNVAVCWCAWEIRELRYDLVPVRTIQL